MKFKDFELKDDNHFIAMQYYRILLNRTFLVLQTNELLIGIKVNGLVSVEGGRNNRARDIIDKMTIKGDLQNPYSYIKQAYLDKVNECELLDGSILSRDKSNFIIKRADIRSIQYDPRKKWGMGYYPHDGKVYIETFRGKRKEFIILGNQSGKKIVDFLFKSNN